MARLDCIWILAAMLCMFAPALRAAELTVADFDFGPPLGSEGASIEKVGPDDFRITLGHAPEHPGWANHLQFRILRNAKGKALHLTVEFKGETQYAFSGNFHSWSYDGINWQAKPFSSTKTTKTGEDTRDRVCELQFEPFEQDTVWFGFQVPISCEQAQALTERWEQHPAVTVHDLGRSLEGRPLQRITITSPENDPPPERRWVHYVANQHPGEPNSMWRMVGMIEWLLSDAGSDARRRSIFHFVLMQSPDGVAHGWHRTNRHGLDMNRTYSPGGANPEQGYEPFIFQRDLESIMASSCPARSIWSMHTWPGAADPNISLSPADREVLGPPELLAEELKRLDPEHKVVKPLKVDERNLRWRTTPWTPADNDDDARGGRASWSSGPRSQFGVTAALCEGGGDLRTKEENVASGRVLVQALVAYYRGLKADTASAE